MTMAPMMNEPLQGERLTFADWDAVNDNFLARGWTDGLPVVPPTEDKVRAAVAASGRAASEVVGVIGPRWAECTVEHAAINAVMAGCEPRVMPVLLAGIAAACDPAFGLYSIQATTHPCGVLMVVSGPIAQALDMNSGHNCFGPGNRANATLGRALRLILVNVGGAVPGAGDMATHGSPGKYSYCFAENEAASPWEPLRVALGFKAEDSTVTVFGAESPHNVNDHLCQSPHTILSTVASVMSTIGSNNATAVDAGDLLVVLGPEHAAQIAKGGMSRKDVQAFLFETARNTVGDLRNRAMWNMMNWPAWIDRDNDRTRVPLVGKPEDIHVIVAGGSGKHSAYIPTFGLSKSVTRKIERNPF
jgi:hypothetical protein